MHSLEGKIDVARYTIRTFAIELHGLRPTWKGRRYNIITGHPSEYQPFRCQLVERRLDAPRDLRNEQVIVWVHISK